MNGKVAPRVNQVTVPAAISANQVRVGGTSTRSTARVGPVVVEVARRRTGRPARRLLPWPGPIPGLPELPSCPPTKPGPCPLPPLTSTLPGAGPPRPGRFGTFSTRWASGLFLSLDLSLVLESS